MKLGLTFLLCLTGVFAAFFALADNDSAVKKIDINTATQKELTLIIHIGDARALELISLRPFSSLDDLVRIKGISAKRVEDIKNQGLAWLGAPEPESKPELELEQKSEIGPEIEIEAEAAAPQSPNSKSVAPIAITTAAFSGAIILLLQIMLKKPQ